MAKVAKGERSSWADGKGTQIYSTSKKLDAGAFPALVPACALYVWGKRPQALDSAQATAVCRMLAVAMQASSGPGLPGHTHLPPWC